MIIIKKHIIIFTDFNFQYIFLNVVGDLIKKVLNMPGDISPVVHVI